MVGGAVNKRSKYRGVTLFKASGKFRAQISSNGKTTSLGDHLTEEEAARAFDRACIHRSGPEANTNFPLSDYAAEVDALQKMNYRELVAMLRAGARRSQSQTSKFKGVTLLRQTARWHSQFEYDGRQVHLGYYSTEVAAARAYDRAMLAKYNESGGGAATPPSLNFDRNDYLDEDKLLASDLLDSLRAESTRRVATAMLEEGVRQATLENMLEMLRAVREGRGDDGKDVSDAYTNVKMDASVLIEAAIAAGAAALATSFKKIDEGPPITPPLNDGLNEAGAPTTNESGRKRRKVSRPARAHAL